MVILRVRKFPRTAARVYDPPLDLVKNPCAASTLPLHKPDTPFGDNSAAESSMAVDRKRDPLLCVDPLSGTPAFLVRRPASGRSSSMAPARSREPERSSVRPAHSAVAISPARAPPDACCSAPPPGELAGGPAWRRIAIRWSEPQRRACRSGYRPSRTRWQRRSGLPVASISRSIELSLPRHPRRAGGS